MGRMASWKLLRSFTNFFSEDKHIYFTHAQTCPHGEERESETLGGGLSHAGSLTVTWSAN